MSYRFTLRAIALSAVLLGSHLNAQITFSFSYTTKSGGASNIGFLDPTFGTARQAALNDAATTLASFFTTSAPVNLTFVVESEQAATSTLASASSNFATSNNGFNQTVVQNKILTGADANGSTADGSIFWNWQHTWDITNSVAGGAYDFKSTVMHELLHAFGFTSSTGAPNSNTGTVWNTFDNFLTNSTGTRLISVGGVFDTGQNSALTGGPGVFFSGSNAMGANGGNRVAIFSPTTWSDGSSGAHTDDGTYPNTMMISATNTGPGARTLTAIERGILTDIGYTMAAIPEPSTYAAILGAAVLGVTVIRRRRQKA